LVVQDNAASAGNEISLVSDESVRGLRLGHSESPPPRWNESDFDDRNWNTAAQTDCLGYERLPRYPNAKWIWLPGCSQRKESVLLRKTFDLPTNNTRGVLRIRANETAEVYLNGQKLGTPRLWTTEFWYDLTPHLRQGRNVLAVRAIHVNDGGYGALMFRADLNER
jgi:hypothetical protein